VSSLGEASETFLLITSDAPSKLHVSGHQSDSLAMEGDEIAVLEKSSEVALSSLLEGFECMNGEPDVLVGGSRNVSDEPLEGEPGDHGLCLTLHLLDLLESKHTWPEAWLLDTTCVCSEIFSLGAFAILAPLLASK